MQWKHLSRSEVRARSHFFFDDIITEWRLKLKAFRAIITAATLIAMIWRSSICNWTIHKGTKETGNLKNCLKRRNLKKTNAKNNFLDKCFKLLTALTSFTVQFKFLTTTNSNAFLSAYVSHFYYISLLSSNLCYVIVCSLLFNK